MPECLTWTTLLNVAMEVARGMAYIHSQGIIHRDLNTSVRWYFAKVLDLLLLKLAGIPYILDF